MNDQLTRLAEVATPHPTIDLGTVQQRARTLRRARRARLGAGTGVVAAALAVAGVLLPPGTGSDSGPGSPAIALGLGAAPARAADAAKDCASGTARWVERAEWAQDAEITGAAHLLEDTTWALTAVGVHETTLTCLPSVPVAVLLDTDPVRGVTVWADVADPLPEGTEGVVDVQVRGTDGRLRDLGGAVHVTWLEDGTRWMANGSGVTADELLADLDGFVLDDGALVDGAAAAGFEVVPATGAPADLTVSRWTATYGDTGVTEGEEAPAVGAGVELEVTTAYQESPELLASYYADGVRFVDVAGTRAVFDPWGDPSTDVGGRLTWQHDGTTYRLSGSVPVERLVELAATVTPVDVSDPAVTGTPELP